MNILLIDRFFGGHDGPGIYIYDLADNLLRRGHRVGLAYGKLVGGFAPAGLEGFHVPGLYEERYSTSAGRRALLKILDEFRPDVVSAQCLDVLWFAEEVSRRCPVVANLLTHAVTCPNWTRLYDKKLTLCERDFGPACLWHNYADRCGPANPKALAENMLRVAAARAALRHTAAVQALTPYMRGTLERAGVPEEKLFDIPVYAPFFDEAREYTPPARPLLLFVGRLHQTKGPDLLLEACARLKVPFELAFVGGGPLAASLEAEAMSHGLSNRCRFYVTEGAESKGSGVARSGDLIRREDLPRLYLDASVVVFPSIWGEPAGIVRLEAMAHGRPLLGFDAGGTAHCIEDGQTGFVIPRLDVTTLAARLEQLLRDPALGERMGRAALRYVKERYHPAALTGQMEEVFRRIIAGLPPVARRPGT
jgi:glycosyltransferase involved in cell wall biosynthesis